MFAEDQKVIEECVAIVKVGHDRKDTPERIFTLLITSILLRFNGLPCKKN